MSTQKKTPTSEKTVEECAAPVEELTNADGGKKEDQPHLVKIKWTDAFSGESGWHYLTTYTTNSVQPTTIGWMFDNQPLADYITVFSTYYYDGENIVVSDPNHIPKAMINELQIVQIAGKE